VTIHWTLLSDLPPAPAAPPPAWLGPAERRSAQGLLVEKRRADWLLGRLAAKRLVARILAEVVRMDLPLDAFDIVTEPSGAPIVRLADGGTLPVGVSISHSEGTAFCAAWADAGGILSVGADLERIAPRPEGFVRDFFRPSEAAAWEALPAGSERDLFASAVWSAKESVLKALRLGLTVDTRSVEILFSEEEAVGAAGLPRPDGGGWKGFAACCAPDLPGGDAPIAGFWRKKDGYVMTLAVTGTPAAKSGS
jgi:4'-phosphopantetheinyl transferase